MTLTRTSLCVGVMAAGAALISAIALTQARPTPPTDSLSPCNTAAMPQEVWVEGGDYIYAEYRRYRDEGPSRNVTVEGFWIDAHEVTNAQFQAFVDDTGYVTLAERVPNAADFANIPAELLVPGSAVFQSPSDLSRGGDITQWWKFIPGANWRKPHGPEHSEPIDPNKPVVHIAYEDALAYADWAGRDLPTETEWEYAARGRRDSEFPWGEQLKTADAHNANTWQGVFPLINAADDGYVGAAPVGCFPANDYGVHDLIGNVWEWTSSPYDQSNNRMHSDDPGFQRAIKGGSFLCAPNYCARYRPAARHAQETGLGTNHIGFRTIRRGAPSKAG